MGPTPYLLTGKLWEWTPAAGVNKPSRRCYCVLRFENCCIGGMILCWLPHIFSDSVDGFEPQLLTVVSWPITYTLLTLVPSLSHIPYFLICTSEDHFPDKLLPPKPLLRVRFRNMTDSGQKPSAEAYLVLGALYI